MPICTKHDGLCLNIPCIRDNGLTSLKPNDLMPRQEFEHGDSPRLVCIGDHAVALHREATDDRLILA